MPVLQDERSVMSFLVRPAAVLISQFFVSYDECGDDGLSPEMSDGVSLNCHVDLDSHGYLPLLRQSSYNHRVIRCLTEIRACSYSRHSSHLR